MFIFFIICAVVCFIYLEISVSTPISSNAVVSLSFKPKLSIRSAECSRVGFLEIINIA